ncbi:hypothetical protein [Parafrankia discariae]|uniref:hypothetical protein n=1 Tax=Parafrankia discariae TaxID=365528 RepID=UPI0003A62893|nr:hypothetical protein [Parafrankia discariae]
MGSGAPQNTMIARGLRAVERAVCARERWGSDFSRLAAWDALRERPAGLHSRAACH